MGDFSLQVIPNASRNQVLSGAGGMLKLKVQAPPEEGRANRAVIELLAKHFGVPKRAIRLLSGEKSREKRVSIEGLEPKSGVGSGEKSRGKRVCIESVEPESGFGKRPV
ncbi:MAG: DUF167 domain-containing protein [Puniceicoccales bacterium]|jgi:uncharacterized protein (TIGR00251 family)|nr:DUF167 domain-containing protein [Puniceicoccales bacterium]